MSIYEQIVSADANRCGSPMHNTRLRVSPARAEVLKAMMASSVVRNRIRAEKQQAIAFEDDGIGSEISIVIKEDSVSE
jgi:hypothetical protein